MLTFLYEHVHNISMTMRRSRHQGCRLRDVARLNLRTCSEQHFDGLCTSGSRGAQQWWLMVSVADVDVSAVRQEQLDRLHSLVL